MPLVRSTGTHNVMRERERATQDRQGEDASALTQALMRGVCRMLADLGFGSLVEFRLPNSRRVDIIGLDRDGTFVIVEVKVSVEDFRNDHKWPEYLPFCEKYYFAVPESFPLDHLPQGHGIIVADGYGGVIRRDGPAQAMNGNRKRRQTLRFALTASGRLQRLVSPAGP